MNEELDLLYRKLGEAKLPLPAREKVTAQIKRLSRLSGADYTAEAGRTIVWVEWVLSLPWEKTSADRLDLELARKILDKNHHGLEEVKERVLEYLSVLKLKQIAGSRHQGAGGGRAAGRAPALLLVGLVGTGKTTLAYSVAQALGRPMARIPLGGLGSVLDLRGQSRLHLEAEPGQIIKAIGRVGVMNPVILLDELDRVAAPARSDIMGVLVELLDPEQNRQFLDYYLGVPFDLSAVLFIATANNTGNIATAVLDRMEVISMPSYTDEDKIVIGRNYLLPEAAREAALPEGSLVVDDDIWPQLVRPLGYDAGIRTLQRTIQSLVRKTAKLIVTGQRPSVRVTKDNIGEYVNQW